MRIIDIHAHAFPDNIAAKAMANLRKLNAPYEPFTEGTVSALLSSMDNAGIRTSFVLNVATKPEQAAVIRKWSREISSERIAPVGSVHPDSANFREEIAGFQADGVKGIKFQPMYQNFAIDEKRMFPIYEQIAASGMFLVFHSGEDIAFPGSRNCSVDKIARVAASFPELKIVAAHFGGWRAWPEVLQHLCGKNIFIETSFMHEVEGQLRGRILSRHDRQRFLFGTDSPWGDQKAQVEFIRNLPDIDEDFKEGIFFRNVALLLGRS
jgi:hypothetical protein